MWRKKEMKERRGDAKQTRTRLRRTPLARCTGTQPHWGWSRRHRRPRYSSPCSQITRTHRSASRFWWHASRRMCWIASTTSSPSIRAPPPRPGPRFGTWALTCKGESQFQVYAFSSFLARGFISILSPDALSKRYKFPYWYCE